MPNSRDSESTDSTYCLNEKEVFNDAPAMVTYG
jgi:hypothetical protein